MDRQRIMNEHLPRIEDACRCKPSCVVCGGAGLVCENHPDKAWPDECECGAGEPCPHAKKP